MWVTSSIFLDLMKCTLLNLLHDFAFKSCNIRWYQTTGRKTQLYKCELIKLCLQKMWWGYSTGHSAPLKHRAKSVYTCREVQHPWSIIHVHLYFENFDPLNNILTPSENTAHWDSTVLNIQMRYNFTMYITVYYNVSCHI